MDFKDVASVSRRIGRVTPGEVLLEDFMKPLGLSARAPIGMRFAVLFRLSLLCWFGLVSLTACQGEARR